MSIELLATSAMGLESVVSRELKELGYEPKNIEVGRTLFTGSERDICRANIHLRSAGRVLIRMGEFPAEDFGQLFDQTVELPWERWLPKSACFPVDGRSVRSKLSSVPACQSIVKKAIVNRLQKAWKATELLEDGPKYPIEVSILKDRATLTIDTTGEGLHRRGYRKLIGSAPLRETLAAGMILLSYWEPNRPLLDPFCGSGTIPIEAALIARNIAPGLRRSFVSEAWSQIPFVSWMETRQAAKDAIRPAVPAPILGCDIDPDAVEMAEYHAQMAGVSRDVTFLCRDFLKTETTEEYGCSIMNPPYGKWIGDFRDLRELYFSIPSVLQKLPTWSHYVFTAFPDFEKLIGQEATRRRKIYNSRLECTFFQFIGPRPPRENDWEKGTTTFFGAESAPEAETAIGQGDALSTAARDSASNSDSASKAESKALASGSLDSARSASGAPVSGNSASEHSALKISALENSKSEESGADRQTPDRLNQSAGAQERLRKPIRGVFGVLSDSVKNSAADFERRLEKLARHYRRWPTRRGITCFRVYDRDVPEIPLAIDRYEDCLHVAEYERPHDRNAALQVQWMELMTEIAGRVFETPRERIFVKQRRRQRGIAQYERWDTRHFVIQANEGGLKFFVNLSDYLDTGLFLDHRLTRDMVRREAKGKRFLNLFSYTGSFSVYAADGGAKSVTTVDLSNTYLDWAQDNMELNGFRGSQYEYVRSDAFRFLDLLYEDETFDLAVLDPPTFSNSKDLADWDVQRDHAEMLNLLLRHMSPGGVVYFSNNNRRFKLDEEHIRGASLREISNRTIPEDFRNKRIHRCWRIVKEGD